MMDFIQDKQLIKDAKTLGFDGEILFPLKSVQNAQMNAMADLELPTIGGYTIEQLERWLWEKHQIKIETTSHRELPDSFVWVYEDYNRIVSKVVNSKSPFNARLEGIRLAVNYIKERNAE